MNAVHPCSMADLIEKAERRRRREAAFDKAINGACLVVLGVTAVSMTGATVLMFLHWVGMCRG